MGRGHTDASRIPGARRDRCSVAVNVDALTRIAQVYAARDTDELTALYDAWAADYDRQIGEEMGYSGPAEATAALSRVVPETAAVLDVGAGTGLVGVVLHARGYRNLTAADVSASMLRVAERKCVYRALHVVDLDRGLPWGPAAFEALIGVGVYTSGHASARSIAELARVCRPGGYVCLSLRADASAAGYLEEIDRLEQKGLLTSRIDGPPFDCFPKAAMPRLMRIVTLQVAARPGAADRAPEAA
jgi:predicted TPR repeat methyltransferase